MDRLPLTFGPVLIQRVLGFLIQAQSKAPGAIAAFGWNLFFIESFRQIFSRICYISGSDLWNTRGKKRHTGRLREHENGNFPDFPDMVHAHTTRR